MFRDQCARPTMSIVCIRRSAFPRLLGHDAKGQVERRVRAQAPMGKGVALLAAGCTFRGPETPPRSRGGPQRPDRIASSPGLAGWPSLYAGCCSPLLVELAPRRNVGVAHASSILASRGNASGDKGPRKGNPRRTAGLCEARAALTRTTLKNKILDYQHIHTKAAMVIPAVGSAPGSVSTPMVFSLP